MISFKQSTFKISNQKQLTEISYFSVSAATASEGVRLGTLRIARLVGPPLTSKKRFSGRMVAGRGR